MADTEQSMDLSINVLIEGVKEKIDDVTSKIKEFGDAVGEASSNAAEKMNPLNNSLNEGEEAAEEASSSFEKMTGAGLALLFAGRFLDQTFGSLARSMFDMFGITDMFSGALKSVLLPAFQLVAPIVIDLINKFMNMGDTAKMIIGFIVMIGAVLAPVIAFVGQFAAGATALSAVLGGAGLAAVLGTLATVIGVVVGALAILWAGFKIGMWIADTLLPLLGDLIAWLGRKLKQGIDKAVGFLKGLWDSAKDIFWGFVDTAKEAIGDAIDKITSLLGDAKDKVINTAKDIGSNIIEGIKQGLKNAGDVIMNVLDTLTPGLPISKIVGAAGDKIDSVTSANDFVLSDGKLIRTHPNDTIMATKDPSSLGQGGESGGDTVIVKDPTVRDDRDVDKIADEVEKRLDRQTRGRSGIR